MNTPLGIYDSHTHLLEMKKKDLPLEEMLKQWDKDGMGWIMDAGVDETHFEERLQYKSLYPRLIFGAGIHPCHCHPGNLPRELLKPQIIHPWVKGIGEIGLDYFWKDVAADLQREYFIEQLKMAEEQKLPVMIHNREADEDIFQILKDHCPSSGGVMHCFSSGPKWLEKFLSLDMYISFAGNITYKKAEDIRESARLVPANRILIETDAPYLSPQRVRGKKNHPGHLHYTLDFLADLRQMKSEELRRDTEENFKKLFNIQAD